jgi:uncharacterized delta-60 repeat protein
MKAVVAAGIVVSALVVLAGVAVSAPGDPDTTFDGDGIVVNDETPLENTEGLDVVVQDDGRIVVVGATHAGFLVVRFTTDGTLDPTFSGNGWIEVKFPGAGWARASAVDLDGSGRIVVGGRSSRGLAVARLLAGGTLDHAFDGDGRATVPDAGLARINDVVVDGSDRIVFAGWRSKGSFEPNGSEMIVGRLTEDGARDPAFRGGGLVAINPPGNSSLAAVDLGPGGRIVAAGEHFPRRSQQAQSVAVRLWPGGRRDRSFGTGGIASIDLAAGYESITGVAAQADGRVALTGWARGGQRLLVARLTAQGRRATAFGQGDGVVVQDLGRGEETGVDVVALANGRLVVLGSMRARFDQRAVVLRYTAAGVLDTSFGGNGWTPVNPTPQADLAEALDRAPTGELVLVAGTPVDQVALARLEG